MEPRISRIDADRQPFAATIALTHLYSAAIFFQGGDAANAGVDWTNPYSLWQHMGFLAKAVVVILFVMSAWSIGVMIDRYIAFNAARKQSRAFAPAVAGALRDAYGGYYAIGRLFVHLIGRPELMRYATRKGMSRPALMR